MKLKKFSLCAALFLTGISFNVSATEITKIAVLNFELNDITSLPNTPDELKRTASFKPILEKTLNNAGEYQIIQISEKEYNAANAGIGYLYKFHKKAALLAEKSGADWIIVGQHSKPSFLFSYLMANLVNTKSGMLVAHYDVELKGNHRKVTERGINALVKKVEQSIRRYRP